MRVASSSPVIVPQRPLARPAAAKPPRAAGDRLRLGAAAHRDGSLVASDGARIAYRQTLPVGAARAIVVMQQGTLGTPGDFDLMGTALSGAGIHSYALGARSTADDYRQHAADLEQLVELARREHPGVPITVMGVSLGAMIALDWSARHNARHLPVVALSPVVANRFLGLGDTARIAAGLLSDRAAEALVDTPMSAGVPLTTNPLSPSAHLRHPEGMKVPARLFGDVTKMTLEVAARGRGMQGPLLIAMAGDDQVAVNAATRAFARALGSEDRTLRTVPGAAHDLSQETNRPDFVAGLADWILAH